LVVGIAVIGLLGASHGWSTTAAVSGEISETPPPPLRPTASLQELMQLEIDPAADFIWGSVGTIVTQAGTLHRRPRTAAAWLALRKRALLLAEATNLLMVRGRRVATRDFPADAPGVLSSTEIQRQWDESPAAFAGYALSLRAASLAVLQAVDQQDAAALSRAGEALDDACETCHRASWYPHQIIPALPAKLPSP
jgi:hypothetical protein